MKKSELKEMIKNSLLAGQQIMEAEEEDVNVDVEDTENIDVDTETEIDVKDEESVEVDDESSEVETDIDVKMPGNVNKDVELVQGLLTKAQQTAEKIGDEKLLSQIGNTITYFTRTHIVKVSEDVSGNIDVAVDDEAADLDAEESMFEANLQEVKKWQKIAGIIKS